jgi:hypothetical protein
MKKLTRKLTLSRETLLGLEVDLKPVAGGVTMNPNICETSGFNTCPTFVRNCTATYLC